MELTISSVMQLILAIPALIALIMKLMTLAQNAFGPNTGTEKKKTVMEALKAFFTNEEVWKSAEGLLSRIIDFLAFFKPKKTA